MGSEFRVASWVGGYIHYPISVGYLLPFLPNVEQLDIKAFYFSFSISRPHEQVVDSTQWLELFRSFPGVEALGVSGVLVRNIGSALERVATGEAPKICSRHFVTFASMGPGDICPKSSNRSLLLASLRIDVQASRTASAERVGLIIGARMVRYMIVFTRFRITFARAGHVM